MGEVQEGEEVVIESEAEGFESDEHRVRAWGPITQVRHGLRRPGQLSYAQGNDRMAFAPRRDRYLIDLNGEDALARLSAATEELELEWTPIAPPWSQDQRGRPDEHSVYAEVAGALETAETLVDAVASDAIRVSTAAIIQHGTCPPLGLTNELAARFRSGVGSEDVERIAASAGLGVMRPIELLENGFLLVGPSAASYDILERSEALRRNPQVVCAEPNLLFQRALDASRPRRSC